MAHKKGAGSSRNGRDSKPKMLGVKRFGGEAVTSGTAIEYGTTFDHGNLRNTARASVTAGFRCAPEILPAM